MIAVLWAYLVAAVELRWRTWYVDRLCDLPHDSTELINEAAKLKGALDRALAARERFDAIFRA